MSRTQGSSNNPTDHAPMNTPSGGGASGGGFDLNTLLTLGIRHFWVILVTFVVVTVCGAVFFDQKSEEEYAATAVVMVQPMTSSTLGGSDAAVTMWASFLDWQRYRSTQLKIMTSTSILSQVAERLDLENDPEFPSGVSSESGEPLTLSQIVEVLKRSVTIEQDGDTMMVRLSVRCQVPRYCSEIANTLAQTYIDFNFEQRVGSGAAAENWLRKQYETRLAALREAEDAIILFRSDRNLISVSLDDQHNITGQNLSALSGRLIEAQYQVDSLEVTMREIQRVRNSGDYLSAGLVEVVENGLVQELKQELVSLATARASLGVIYLDDHPEMKANAEKQRLVKESLIREIDAELSSLQLRYDTGRSLQKAIESKMLENYADAMEMGGEQIEYERLLREAELNRTLLSRLEERLHEVELANQLEPRNIQVMEEAVLPTVSMSATGLPAGLIAAVLGLILGLGIAFVLEVLDNTVRTHEQIEKDFELPFLGIVPTMGVVARTDLVGRGPVKGEAYNPDTFVRDSPRSSMAEALRSIRTNLAFMSVETPLQLFLVTSAAPLEGKSTIAISLATTMAQAGKSVLLVDNDMRKPRLHKTLDLDTTHGLTSILSGACSLDDALQDSGIPGVQALACGPIPMNPTELMMSAGYDALLGTLRERFDVIVLDAPPVTPVTDSVLLSQKVDGVLVVVRAGKTTKATLRTTRDQLDAVAAPIAGVVLNDVDVTSRRKGYYYTYGQYGAYYGANS